MTLTEINAFKREIPDLRSLLLAGGPLGISRSKNLADLTHKAIQVHGNLSRMPTGCWKKEQNYYLYICLIKDLHDSSLLSTQQLMLEMLTKKSYVEMIIRNFRLDGMSIGWASQETLCAAFNDENQYVFALHYHNDLHKELVKSCDSETKYRLIQQLLIRHKNKLLPAFKQLEDLSPFMHIESVRTKIQLELMSDDGMEFNRLVRKSGDLIWILKTYELPTLMELTKNNRKRELSAKKYLQIPEEISIQSCFESEELNDCLIELCAMEAEIGNGVVVVKESNVLIRPPRDYYESTKSRPDISAELLKRFTSEQRFNILRRLIRTIDDLIVIIFLIPQPRAFYARLLFELSAKSSVAIFIRNLRNLVYISNQLPDIREEIFSSFFISEKNIGASDLWSLFIEHPIISKKLWLFIQGDQRLYSKFVQNLVTHVEICRLITTSQTSFRDEETVLSSPTSRYSSQGEMLEYQKKLFTLTFEERHLKANGVIQKDDPDNWMPDNFKYLLNKKHQKNSHVSNNAKFILNKWHERAIFTECFHGTNDYNVRMILRCGVIFPRSESNIEGLSLDRELCPGDQRLTFTAPIEQHGVNSITFSIPLLSSMSKLHQDERVVFRIYPWCDGASGTIKLTPNIALEFNFFGDSKSEPESLNFIFKELNGSMVSVPIEMPGHESVFFGYKGLNEYMRLYIFKLIEAIPNHKTHIKDKIYQHFRELEEKDQLTEKLKDIALSLSYKSEFNFLGRIYLHQTMIKNVQLSGVLIDFDEIRSCIKQDDVTGLNAICAQNVIFELISSSFFLANGFLEYAKQLHSIHTIRYLLINFHRILDTRKISDRKELLLRIAPGIVEQVYTLYSPPCPGQSADEPVLLRPELVSQPSHCAVDTVICALMSKYILKIFQEHSKEPFLQQAKALDPHEIVSALLSAVTGRQSEIAFHDESKKYSQCASMDGSENEDILRVIMCISHKSILIGIFDDRAMKNERLYMQQFLQPENADKISLAILEYSTRLIDAAGGSIRASYSPDVSIRTHRIEERFVPYGQFEHYEHLIDMLALVPEPNFELLTLPSETSLPLLHIEPQIAPDFKVVVYQIADEQRQMLREIVSNSRGFFGFFYRGTQNDYQSFARCLSLHENKISKSILDNLKKRYPLWNAGVANKLIEVIAQIESTEPKFTSSASNTHCENYRMKNN